MRMNIKKSVLNEVKIVSNDLAEKDPADAYLIMSFRDITFPLSCNENGDTPGMYNFQWDDFFSELENNNISILNLFENISKDDDYYKYDEDQREEYLEELFLGAILNLDIIEDAYDNAEKKIENIIENLGFRVVYFSPEQVQAVKDNSTEGFQACNIRRLLSEIEINN